MPDEADGAISMLQGGLTQMQVVQSFSIAVGVINRGCGLKLDIWVGGIRRACMKNDIYHGRHEPGVFRSVLFRINLNLKPAGRVRFY